MALKVDFANYWMNPNQRGIQNPDSLYLSWVTWPVTQVKLSLKNKCLINSCWKSILNVLYLLDGRILVENQHWVNRMKCYEGGNK